MNTIKYTFILLAITVFDSALSSDQIPGEPQSQPIAIVGGTLHTVSDGTLSSGTVVFERGKITQLSEGEVPLPEGCKIIDAKNKHVYPSIIEAYSDLGLVEINSVRATLDRQEVGEFNPNVRSVSAFNPDSEIIPVSRANGILLAVSAPRGGTISGRSSLMMLDGWTWEDMTLRANTGMHINWPRDQEGEQELEAFFEQAHRYVVARASSSVRQPMDLRFDSLAAVLAGEMPLIVNATALEDIQSAVAFANKHQTRLIILGGYDAAKCSGLLKSQDVPVIISSVYRSPRRRHEAYDESYTLPKQLADAGVKFCISAGGRFGANGIRNLPYNAATAAAYGLDESEALRAITLSTAEILGVQDRVGSLQTGRDATLFIADGDILETPTHVEVAFIQGRTVDLDNKQEQLYRKYSAKYARER